MPPPTNDELIQRAQAGDRVAIDELCLRLYPVAFGLLYRLSGNRHDAEDLAQGVFVVFTRRRPYLHSHQASQRASGQLTSWVLGAAWRLWHNFRCNPRNTQKRGLSNAEWEDLASREFEPSEPAEKDELAARLLFRVQELPPDLRDVLIWFHLDGKSFREISEDTGISEGTLKPRASTARQKLYERIASSEPDLALWMDSLSTTSTGRSS